MFQRGTPLYQYPQDNNDEKGKLCMLMQQWIQEENTFQQNTQLVYSLKDSNSPRGMFYMLHLM
jgi:hypothetical protein